MYKSTLSKPTHSRSIVHATVIPYYEISQLKEDDYYHLGSKSEAKKNNPFSKKKSNKGVNMDFPHAWEMTDYDDDHFEWVAITH